MPCSIRRAGSADAEELTAIAHDAKRHWGYPADMMALWRDELTLTPGYLTQHPVHVASLDGRDVGLYGLSGSGAEWELEHLWVRPDSHGRGVGRALFEHAVSTARIGGASSIKIVSDPNADAFYSKMGARRDGDAPSRLAGRRLPVFRFDL